MKRVGSGSAKEVVFFSWEKRTLTQRFNYYLLQDGETDAKV
jgi:hypothetical protein